MLAIIDSHPSKVTINWSNQKSKAISDRRIKLKAEQLHKLEIENSRIQRNLLSILNESRENSTEEYCPGYRRGM